MLGVCDLHFHTKYICISQRRRTLVGMAVPEPVREPVPVSNNFIDKIPANNMADGGVEHFEDDGKYTYVIEEVAQQQQAVDQSVDEPQLDSDDPSSQPQSEQQQQPQFNDVVVESVSISDDEDPVYEYYEYAANNSEDDDAGTAAGAEQAATVGGDSIVDGEAVHPGHKHTDDSSHPQGHATVNDIITPPGHAGSGQSQSVDQAAVSTTTATVAKAPPQNSAAHIPAATGRVSSSSSMLIKRAAPANAADTGNRSADDRPERCEAKRQRLMNGIEEPAANAPSASGE